MTDAGSGEEVNRVAAYIRVSTEKQKEEGSHESQRERIEQWADAHSEYKFEDIEWYEDLAISGQSDQREAYNRLMNEYSDYDAVVVRELSRFGRDPLTVLQDVEKIAESDTEFISVTESFDTSSAMGKAFIRIMAVINGMYSDLRSEQAVKAAERRRERGDPVGRPDKVPDEDPLREQIYDLRRKGVSYSSIARIIEGEPEGPDEMSRATIRRYCKDAGVEPESTVE